MLYYLTEFSDKVSVFNVFRYITFRTGGAVITSLVFVFLLEISSFKLFRLSQHNGELTRSDGASPHLASDISTQAMGGPTIVSALAVSTLLWANPRNPYVWIVLGVTLGFALIGLCDDNRKFPRLSGRTLLAIEAMIAAAACHAIAMAGRAPLSTFLVVPAFKSLEVDLGWLFLAFGALIIVGAANAAKLTDRLGNLALVPLMIVAVSFGMICYLAGNAVFAEHLQIHYVAGTGELAVLCGAVIGAGLGFLWLNAPPASILMGDTGSLALGGLLGAVAVATKHEIVLAVIGGFFVLWHSRQ
jgi:phospho-N-acetylmuramoyl-pentapeptide-transferase